MVENRIRCIPKNHLRSVSRLFKFLLHVCDYRMLYVVDACPINYLIILMRLQKLMSIFGPRLVSISEYEMRYILLCMSIGF